MNKKIFITGASGFAGKSLTNFLKKKKFQIIPSSFKNTKNVKNIKIDLTKKILMKKNLSWIIHSAAHHRVKDFKSKPKLKGKKNILMVKNLINFMKINKVKNFIYFSTIDLNFSPYPVQKKIYCKSKEICEKILLSELEKKNLEKLIILRLPAIVGKHGGDNFIKNTLKNLKNNSPINIWNMNSKYNNLIHVDDLNKLILYFISEKNKKKQKKIIVDCLSSKPIKLQKLIIYLKNKLKSNSKINYMTKKNKFKKNIFNSKIDYRFFNVKKVVDLLI